MSKEYKYVLQYIDGDKKITHEFSADIVVEDLVYELRDFLAGTSWTESTIKQIIKGV